MFIKSLKGQCNGKPVTILKEKFHILKPWFHRKILNVYCTVRYKH